MKLPYVIDNQTHVLADILKGLLTGRQKIYRESFWTLKRFLRLDDEDLTAKICDEPNLSRFRDCENKKLFSLTCTS